MVEGTLALPTDLLMLTAGSGASTSELGGEALAGEIGYLSFHTGTSTHLASALHGPAGSAVAPENGSTLGADTECIRRTVIDRSARIVEAYPPAMPRFGLSGDENEHLVEYGEGLRP